MPNMHAFSIMIHVCTYMYNEVYALTVNVCG